MGWWAAVVIGQAAAAIAPPAYDGPIWEVVPQGEQIARFYPQRALERELTGRTILSCQATATGELTACSIVEETPSGWGFGEAALRMSRLFRLRVTTAGGQPVEGETVPLNIDWNLGGGTARNVRRLSDPVWRQAPARSEVAAAAEGASGIGIVRCVARETGRLRDCQVAIEEPSSSDIGERARSLSAHFQLAQIGTAEEPLEGVRVEYRVRFGRDAPGYVVQPRWTSSPSGEELQAALEPLARTATGQTVAATVDCEVAEGGTLRGCRVLRATNAEVGVAVATLAGRFALSPWSDAGQSWIGARIRLPLQYVAD